jgi:hypothetical protein
VDKVSKPFTSNGLTIMLVEVVLLEQAEITILKAVKENAIKVFLKFIL